MKLWLPLSLSLLAACQTDAPEADRDLGGRVDRLSNKDRIAVLEAQTKELQTALTEATAALESYRNQTDLEFIRVRAELDVLGDATCDLDAVASDPSAVYGASFRMVRADYCGDGVPHTTPHFDATGYTGDFASAGLTAQEAKDLWTAWVASGSGGSFAIDKDTLTYEGALVVDTKLGATMAKLLATRDATFSGSLTFQDGDFALKGGRLRVYGDLVISGQASVGFTDSSLEVSGGSMHFKGTSASNFTNSSIVITSGNLFITDGASVQMDAATVDIVGGDLWISDRSAVRMSDSSLVVTGGDFILHDHASFTSVDSEIVASAPFSPWSGTLSLSHSAFTVNGGDLLAEDSSMLLLHDGGTLSVTGGSILFSAASATWIEAGGGIGGKDAIVDSFDGYLKFDGTRWIMPTLVPGYAADFIDGQVVYLRLAQEPGADDYVGLNEDLHTLVAMHVVCEALREKDPTAMCEDTSGIEAQFAIFGSVLGLNTTKKDPPIPL